MYRPEGTAITQDSSKQGEKHCYSSTHTVSPDRQGDAGEDTKTKKESRYFWCLRNLETWRETKPKLWASSGCLPALAPHLALSRPSVEDRNTPKGICKTTSSFCLIKILHREKMRQHFLPYHREQARPGEAGTGCFLVPETLAFLYWFARAAMPKCHTLAGSDNRSWLSHRSRCWKSTIKASAGLVSSEGCAGVGSVFKRRVNFSSDTE